ncbi:MAG TPA: transcription-repair coupling factor [Xanthomonadaceae bacterium]|jgi:transcription-repair coupling factor (superfamily II helicase)
MSKSPPIPVPPLPKAGQQRAYWRAPASPSALAFALTRCADAHDGLVLAVARDTQAAHTLESDLRLLAARGGDGALPVLHFPDWETLPYDLFGPHPDIVSQRIATLYGLPSARRGVLVVPVATLMQRLCPTGYVGGRSLAIERGQKLDLLREQRRLEAAGYRNVQQVLDPGDYAVRGGLLDLYPMGADEPYRIELLDDVIDTIRSFDPETQRSSHPVESVRLLPAREFPLDETSVKRVREALRERFDIDTRRSGLYQDLKEGSAPAGIEYYLPLFFAGADEEARAGADDPAHGTATLFDYLADDTLVVLGEDALDAGESFWSQTKERWEQRRHDIERPILEPRELFLPPEALRERINRHRRVEVCGEKHPKRMEAEPLGDQPAPTLPLNQKNEMPCAALTGFLASYPGRVLVAADSPGRREALLEQFAAAGLIPQPVANWQAFLDRDGSAFAIAVAPLEDGFALTEPALCVLTERQFHPERAPGVRRRRRVGKDPETIIRDLGDLAVGEPIVHEDHGVGRYRGLITLDAGGERAEYLEIEYAKGDKLYVPVAQLHLVNRYSGASPETAPLHSLGGEQWAKAKKKAAERVRDVAAELLEIQARRHAREGLAIIVDRSLYEPFAANFPFEETPDQLQAIEAVISDLARPQPMDRVVCGDVGFGKTEVALRAAFVAATAGRQVAVLVPTTLLAQQHGQNFRDRFADWPIRVEVVSRFRSSKEMKSVIDALAAGKVDVIVGTHRLLQADVKFPNLGLVIVDEEQRFGVQQKEALKKLRAEVNLLTLTATPIPRTLNMAMSGLRELSLIATAPANRLAVKTLLTPWDGALLREAMQREIARGGQVYFLHNQVESIERMARSLAELMPEARIRVGHGQMPERELEQVMLDFQRQRFNVLLCTTIIESGIDIPNANTIIIDRADRFGLAQLHQLRGRVGRSHHRAYAYLIVPDRKSMTGDAAKRLEAIASLEELGAGFTLATHDMEIRGAGELLGAEQSGQIAEVGFTLYTELLERAVRSMREGKLDLDAEPSRGAEIDLHVPALIPEDYLPDVHERLTMYKRIASARDVDALRELQVEMIDRFGLLPEQAKHLFAIAELRQAATKLGIRKLDLGAGGGRIVFDPKPNVDPMSVIRMIQKQPKVYALEGPEKLRVRMEMADGAARLAMARGLLAVLHA